MQASIVLTVAQGKRLIAKAVTQVPAVRHALQHGTLAIGRGTTNGYVAEEILNVKISKGEYVAGRTLPPGVAPARLGTGQYPDIVIKHGQRVEGMTIAQAVEGMEPGDVLIKGGNALNYAQQTVGVLIGHPCGGTTGDNYGTVISRKIHLIIPIGLEKVVYEDIDELSRASRQLPVHPSVSAPALFPITGTIITEIEALALLFGVTARLYAAGGVAGAEGAIWLLLEGSEAALDAALDLHERLTREPNIELAP
ncbi:MAG TPA: hypothetical protein VGL77_02475 [Armatimonadota bacterium]|jgi:hypothetical protein